MWRWVVAGEGGGIWRWWGEVVVVVVVVKVVAVVATHLDHASAYD